VLSGIWGLAMQQVLPRRMLDEVPAETIYGQIDHVVGLLAEEAQRLVLATCGPAEGTTAATGQVTADDPGSAPVTVGAVRTAGKVQGMMLQTRVPRTPVPEAEPLRAFFQQAVLPYLRGNAEFASPLHQPNRARGLFENLRTRLPPAAQPTVDALE